MEKEIEKLKQEIENFIKKWQLKELSVKTDINYCHRFNKADPNNWISENYSVINRIDINLTK